MQTPIQPVSIFPNKTAVTLVVDDVLVTLGTSANMRWQLLAADGSTVASDRIQLADNDYALWTGDDGYVLNYVLTALKLTPAPAS